MFDLSLKGKGKIFKLPFWHYVEDDFLPEELANELYSEFPSYKDQNLQPMIILSNVKGYKAIGSNLNR